MSPALHKARSPDDGLSGQRCSNGNTKFCYLRNISCVPVTVLIDWQLYSIFFYLAQQTPPPKWVMASSFMRFLDHIRHTTFGRTPLDEGSARRRDLYLTTLNTYNKHPFPWWDSNPQSQQASGHRPTP